MPKSKRALFYVSLLLITVFLWNTGILYPVRMLAVFFHELWHLLASLSTGGRVKEFVLVPQEGGHVITEGGNAFFVGTAGYLGSLLSGIVILVLSDRTKFDRLVAGVLGLIVVFIGFAFGDTLFTVLFCLVVGSLLLGMALFLPSEINDLVLRFLGLSVMLYAPYDVFTDVFLSNAYLSDAGLLSERVGGSPRTWGTLWMMISLIAISSVMVYLLNKPLPGEEVEGEGETHTEDYGDDWRDV